MVGFYVKHLGGGLGGWMAGIVGLHVGHLGGGLGYVCWYI